MWINRSDRLPDKNKKYLVAVNCDGAQRETYCSFNIKTNKFHFDMMHINWFVVGWYDADYAPKFNK